MSTTVTVVGLQPIRNVTTTRTAAMFMAEMTAGLTHQRGPSGRFGAGGRWGDAMPSFCPATGQGPQGSLADEAHAIRGQMRELVDRQVSWPS
jgi:hypothetical protein